MRYYAYGAAVAGMVAIAATAVSWAQTNGNTQAGTTAAVAAPTSPTPAASAAAPTQPAATSPAKPQEIASSPSCPPAPVRRHVVYHHRIVPSRVRSETYMASYGGYSSIGSYGAEYAVAAAPPPPPPVYYAPPPVPVWYAPEPRPWFGGPWHHWWHRWR